RSGYRIGAQLAGAPDVSALFVANDQMALGALRALGEAGVRVPDDVSVIGFDDIPESEFFTPPLTTVAQDFSEVGRRGIGLLIDMLEAPAESASPHPARSVVPARLVARVSTAPARA
ncbi:substrate-binding domain-containing protein, partial [Streptomonospora algeriensis]